MAIQDILEIHNENTATSLAGLGQYSEELPEALEEAGTLYETTIRVFSQGASDREDVEIIEACGSELGVEDREHLSTMLSGDLPEEPEKAELVANAKAAWDRMWSRRIRSMLLLHIHRSYMFSVTDLLRLRVSSALGYLRLQIEAAAQMSIIFRNPSVAYEWLQIRDDDAGRKYHRSHMESIKEFREFHDLDFAWNQSSGTSQHVRFASVVLGMQQRDYNEDNTRVTEIRLNFQESDHEKPENYILMTLTILRTQERLFRAMREGLPEVSDPILIDVRLPRFFDKVERLWNRLPSVFPSQVQKWTRQSTQ